MRFEWDAAKSAANRRKHRVTFDEAATVFLDSWALTGADPDHSIAEARWITFGRSSRGNLLAVAHTEHGDIIRIISARRMSRSERVLYEQG